MRLSKISGETCSVREGYRERDSSQCAEAAWKRNSRKRTVDVLILVDRKVEGRARSKRRGYP
jgi:hypothetical protein